MKQRSQTVNRDTFPLSEEEYLTVLMQLTSSFGLKSIRAECGKYFLKIQLFLLNEVIISVPVIIIEHEV